MSGAEASPGAERAGLVEFLDDQREALINKLDGATVVTVSSSVSWKV